MKARSHSVRQNEILHAYLFISPFFLLFIIFQLYPLIWSFVLGFYKWNGLTNKVFVGLSNYRQLMGDQQFWTTMENTLWYVLANILITLPISVLLGMLLCSRGLKCGRAYKTILVLPYVTSTVAAGIIFSMLFSTHFGVINGILAQLGIAPVGWLNTMKWSKVPVIILSVWRNTPWYMLIVMSALLGVDMNLYEAARIDGANALQRMFFITLPCIMPVLMFCLMNLTIDSVRIFTEPYILTSGGPGASSMSVIQYLYTSAFDTFKMGYASAMGYILTLFLVFVSVFYFKTLRRQSGV